MRSFPLALALTATLLVGGCSSTPPRPDIVRATTVPAPRPDPRATALAARTFELTEYLARFAPDLPLPDAVGGQVTYHDSCKGLRGLGIKQQPRALLARMPDVMLVEMSDCEECCGFGGTFSLKHADISGAMVRDKVASACATGSC